MQVNWQSLKYSEGFDDPRFKQRNFEGKENEIKANGVVIRGGVVEVEKPTLQDHTEGMQINMDVDVKARKYANENAYEETKREKKPFQRRRSTSLSKAVKSSYQTPQQDKEDAMGYISMLQSIQRRRRFADISNELNQNMASETQESGVSRHESGLAKSNPTDEICGKMKISDELSPQAERMNATESSFVREITMTNTPQLEGKRVKT